MPEATEQLLNDLLDFGARETYRLTQIEEDNGFWYLGAVGLSVQLPRYRCIAGFAYGGNLSTDSRFMVKLVSRQSRNEEDVIFVILRRFDSSSHQSFPEDIVAGWVYSNSLSTAQSWIDRMNRQIETLRDRSAESQPLQANNALLK